MSIWAPPTPRSSAPSPPDQSGHRLRGDGRAAVGVHNPELYQVRTGEVFLPKGADWVEETKELRKAFVEHAV